MIGSRVTVRDAVLAAPVRHVTYYSPLSHYFAADLARIATAFAAVGLGLIVLIIAYRRWLEERRSATWFLVAVILSMVIAAAASLVGLGRPPTWWLIALRGVLFIAVVLGCYFVVGESKRGHWARRDQ